MKRLLAILLLIPSLAFGTFTEFYCDPVNGSNLNGGSDSGTSVYTSTNGNWTSSTLTFVPTDGSNPATASPGVAVGQFASVYIDGATTGVYIARVASVTNAVNGSIILSATAKAGSFPTTSATARSIKVGGVWKGPNGSIGFPFSLGGFNSNVTNTTGNLPRINLKNNGTYSISTAISTSGGQFTVQGYTTTPADGGKAIIDTGANLINALSTNSTLAVYADLIFTGSQASNTVDLVVTNSGSSGSIFRRCIAHGSRGSGFRNSNGGGNIDLIECEAYGNNTSNSAGKAGFEVDTTGVTLFRCYSHDNTGSNSAGFLAGSNSTLNMVGCISDSNGGVGFLFGSSGMGANLEQCDAYNNGSDGMKTTTDVVQNININSCNLIKNGGWGINFGSALTTGEINNCGFGSGTQANTSGAISTTSADETNRVTYASGVTPYFAPTTGDFRISLLAAVSAGRGFFLQTGNSKTGTVGFPDIGAAQHLNGSAGTVNAPVSYGFAQ
jgi:hypothetical protein